MSRQTKRSATGAILSKPRWRRSVHQYSAEAAKEVAAITVAITSGGCQPLA